MELTYKGSRTTRRIELELGDLATNVVHLRSDSSNTQAILNNVSGAIPHEIFQSSTVQKDALSGMERVVPRRSSQDIVDPSTKSRSEVFTRPLSSRGEVESSSFICGLTERRRCFVHCICICHRPNSIWSPSFLCHALGLLLIGYNGSARVFQECDTKTCRAQSTKKWYVYYMFPRWVLSKVIFISLCFQGPELLLRCLRTCHFQTTPAFQSVSRGQLHHVQSLMAANQASVLDVDEFGISLLQVSLPYMIHSRDGGIKKVDNLY